MFIISSDLKKISSSGDENLGDKKPIENGIIFERFKWGLDLFLKSVRPEIVPVLE